MRIDMRLTDSYTPPTEIIRRILAGLILLLLIPEESIRMVLIVLGLCFLRDVVQLFGVMYAFMKNSNEVK